MHGTSCPKSQLKSTCLTTKFGNFLGHAEMGEKGQNVISSSVQHPISLIFAIHVSFIIPLPMMWILLTKPMQKYVTTVCLHCSFARLKNKHIGVLGTNVATISWLHFSPVSGYIAEIRFNLDDDRRLRVGLYSCMSSCKYSGANPWIHQNFVHDTVSYWQPVQFLKYRGDMVMKTCASYKPGPAEFCILWSFAIHVWVR